MGGTVAITSVGMFGGGHSGWGLTPTPQSLGLVVGGIAWKPAVVEGRVEPREILNLTVLFDHDVVDGAPATRFTRRLVGVDRERVRAGSHRRLTADASKAAAARFLAHRRIHRSTRPALDRSAGNRAPNVAPDIRGSRVKTARMAPAGPTKDRRFARY